MKRLTATQGKKAPVRDKPYWLFDGRGLFLLVTPAGTKYWRLNTGTRGARSRDAADAA